MTINELMEAIAEQARRSNMTFGQMVDWISRNDREEDILPWEDENNENK